MLVKTDLKRELKIYHLIRLKFLLLLIKKSSYDFGYLEIDGNINIEEFIVQGLRDKNSSLIIDSTKLQNFTKNIIPIIYKKKIEYLF